MSRRIHIVMGEDMISGLDNMARRLDVSRGECVRRTIEAAIGDAVREAPAARPPRVAARPTVAACAPPPSPPVEALLPPNYAAEKQARLNAGKARGKR